MDWMEVVVVDGWKIPLRGTNPEGGFHGRRTIFAVRGKDGYVF
jgi:hypothetical protein